MIFFKLVKTGKITDKIFVLKSKHSNLFLFKDNKHIICIDSGPINNKLWKEFGKIEINPN